MMLAACPVFANWMPTAGELGEMFGQALGEQIGEAIGRQIWGNKVYDDFNKQHPYGLPDNVTNPQPITPQYAPSQSVPASKPASKPWWQFW